jgi:hypothetical protein
LGAVFTLVSPVPGADIDIGGRTDPGAALGTGIGLLCLGVLFIAIPVVVGFLTLRNRPAAATVIEGAAVYPPPASYQPPASTGGAAVYTPPASTPPGDITLPPSMPEDDELPPTS